MPRQRGRDWKPALGTGPSDPSSWLASVPREETFHSAKKRKRSIVRAITATQQGQEDIDNQHPQEDPEEDAEQGQEDLSSSDGLSDSFDDSLEDSQKVEEKGEEQEPTEAEGQEPTKVVQVLPPPPQGQDAPPPPPHLHAPQAAPPSMEEELFKEGSYTEIKEMIVGASRANIIKVDDGVKEQIMQALSTRNPGENIIGLYGPRIKVMDVVRTAIRRAGRDQLFQQIVKAYVSKKPHIRKIQSQIGAEIGLSFDDDDDEPDPGCLVFLAKNKRMSTAERASLLCAKMKELQTVLVVLYDLHGSLDLDKVGIPSAADHNGCKILLTSSSHDVLSNQLKAHVLIQVL